MPRAAAATGRADYPPMLDARWRQAVQGPVGQQFTGDVIVSEPGVRGEYNEDTHQHDTVAGAVVYAGKARLVSVGAIGTTPENAGQTTTLRGYRLSIEYPGAVFKPGQVVRFTSDDPILSSRVLTVMANQTATDRIQTDVLVEDNES